MSEETPVNLPFDRIPECACDPGFGPRITPQQKLDCRMHGGQCSRNAAPSSPMTTPTPDVSDEAVYEIAKRLANMAASADAVDEEYLAQAQRTLAALLARAKAAETDRDKALKFAKDVWETDDPMEPVADNGMTVWDLLVKDARTLAELSERIDPRDARIKALEGALREAQDWAKGFAHPKQPILARIDAALKG